MLPRIKWRPQDQTKLSAYVRKFNAAITRLEKKNPEIVGTGALPQRLDIQNVKSGITTRRDYNKQIAKIDRFFKKGAQTIIKDKTTGYYITKWGKREETYLQRSVNAKRANITKLFKLNKKDRKILDLNQLDFEATKREIFNKITPEHDMEDIANITQEWQNFLYTTERESRDLYLENTFYNVRPSYFKALRERIEVPEVEDLIKLLQQNDIWGTDILLAVAEDDALSFETIYSLQAKYEKLEQLIEHWKEIIPKLQAKRKRFE